MSVGLTPLHEAGHLIVGHLLGLESVEATVVRDGTYSGSVRFKDTPTILKDQPDRVRRHLVTALAGRAAVQRLYRNPGQGCSADDDHAWALARQLVGDDPNHAAEVALVVKESWDEARELVRDYSQALIDVAHDLETFKTMDGAFLTRRVAEAVARDRASPIQQRERDTRQAFWRCMEEQAQGGSNGREG